MVTNESFTSFLHCSRKAFLHAAGTPGHPTDIETVLLDLGQTYRRQALEAFLLPYAAQDVVHDPLCLKEALKWPTKVIVNATASGDGMSSVIQAAERVKGVGQRNSSVFAPVLFILNETVSHADKMLIAFNALALSSVQGVLPSFGKIIHGNACKVLKCKLAPLVSEARKLVAKIQDAQTENAVAPRVSLIRHCNICEFQVACLRLAEEADDLSLMRGLSEKEIQKQRSRGITTVTQFSHTYRPGKRGKRKAGKARRHDHALQAVALRDKKVYVLDGPTIPHSRVSLYLDVEGITDRGFDYLIGLVAVVGDCTTTHFFWADDRTQEKAIWDACSQVINSFEDYTLYHYGQYELRFLDRMSALADEEGAAAIARIRARACNVLAIIYSHIYFPTQYNGLKHIAAFLGASWTAANASGIQSVAWRLAWEVSRDETLKQQLIRYNLEDCLALRRVTEFVHSVCDTAEGTNEDKPAIATAADLDSINEVHFGKNRFFCPELAEINRCAYSDYQREKIYLRTSPAVRKSLRRKAQAGKKRLKVNEEIEFDGPVVCPNCAGEDIRNEKGARSCKAVDDLKFTSSGVKRWNINYRSRRYRCVQCNKPLLAPAYQEIRFHLGRNLCNWAIYHHVSLRQSGRDIAQILNDLFGFSYKRTILTQITPVVAKQQRAAYERIKEKLRGGTLIHGDETKGIVKGHSGYVWVFTNMEEVIYTYAPTREGAILEEMLESFTGVLVSDFYAAYDTLNCLQQKCLIHLMRDINDDIFHRPFDEELKNLAQRLVAVLKPIIDTIDRFGLKKYYLNKHKVDVAHYFSYLSMQTFGSEVAQNYKKRMQKYRSKLFVFLDHDGIPWNNNNAENAIKPFASRRKIIQASFSEKGLQNYLMLLSIAQTCRNKNLSFLRFLLSGKQDIDVFANDTRG